MIVADTNLISFLLLPGPRTAAAEGARRRDPDWVSPRLWRSEFRSVLVLSVRQGLLGREMAEQAWTDSTGLVEESDPAPGSILDAALTHGLSAYHAEFVALAEALGTVLVTDDRRLVDACPGVAVTIDEFGGGA